jgi:predicted enzyme related to lactoylglutathione lyase
MTERVLGIGGVFFRAKDHAALAVWYREHLGIEQAPDFVGSVFVAEKGDETVWAPFASDTTYFGPNDKELMVNYRVRDLDAMIVQLRAAHVPVDDRFEETPNGRFAWATDLEGNRFELWEPAR